MSKAVSFADHISGQLDCVRARQNRIKSKAAELEAALQLIHPEYSVGIGDDTAKNLASANLQVKFQGRPFSVYLDLVKHDDIYISDHVMELLIDRPVMCEDSPYFNAVLKRLVDLGVSLMDNPSLIHVMTKERLIERRDLVVEIYAKMQTSLKDAMTLIRNEFGDDLDKSLVDMVDETDFFLIPECDPIGRIDRRLASMSKEREIEVRPFVSTLKRIPARIIFTHTGPSPTSLAEFELFWPKNQ